MSKSLHVRLRTARPSDRGRLSEAHKRGRYQALAWSLKSALVDEVIAATGAESIRDMGKVMGQIKARAAGRADMGTVSATVKERLNAL